MPYDLYGAMLLTSAVVGVQGSQVLVIWETNQPYEHTLQVQAPTPAAGTAAGDAAPPTKIAAIAAGSGAAAGTTGSAAGSGAGGGVDGSSPPQAVAVQSRVVVEVTGLTFTHYSKSVANNYGVYVEVRGECRGVGWREGG